VAITTAVFNKIFILVSSLKFDGLI